MFTFREPPIIISVGGSLLIPNGGVDTVFLSKLNKFIRSYVKQGKRFFLVAGGGKLARVYRDAGKEIVGGMTDEDLDWLGIHVTRLNAHLLRTIFQDIAHPRIIENYDRKLYRWKEPVVIGAGWKPGWATDYDSVLLARDYGARVIINLSNIDWVYDKDPHKFPDAKIIKKLTWEEMEKLVGNKWKPGTNAPFDPIATQLAKDLKLTVIVANGSNFENMERIMNGDEFIGTVILPYNINASFYDREYYTGGKKKGYRLKLTESLFGSLLRYAANLYRAMLIRFFIKPKKCLDIGCGTGGLISILRSWGVDACGLEMSQTAIDLADKKIKPYIKEGNLLDIPYPDNSFDLVMSYDVMDRIERGKIKKAIEESIRVSSHLVLHKIYTLENGWIRLIHVYDFSRISVFRKSYWKNLLKEFPSISVLKNKLPRLPVFFETLFLLKKK